MSPDVVKDRLAEISAPESLRAREDTVARARAEI